MTVENLGVKLYSGLKSDRVSDSLGSSADGVNTNVTLDTTNEKLGTGCYNFDGSGDKVVIGTSTTFSSTLTDGSTDWTIAFWMKLNSINQGENQAIFAQGQGLQQGLDIMYDDRGSGFLGDHLLGVRLEGVGGNTALKLYTSDNFIPQDTNWHHYVITADISTRTTTAYRDGGNAESNSSGASGNFPSASDLDAPMTFGYHPSTGFGDLNAKLDDCGIWNRILTSDERTSLWNDGDGALVSSLSNKSELKAYYSFDSLSGASGAWNELTTQSGTNNLLYSARRYGVKIVSGNSAIGNESNGLAFKISNSNYPSGDVFYYRVYRSDDGSGDADTAWTQVATTAGIPASEIPSSHDWLVKSFISPVTLAVNDVVCIEADDVGSNSAYINLAYNSSTSNIASANVKGAFRNNGESDQWTLTDSGTEAILFKILGAGCKNNASSTSPLEALDGVRINDIFTQVDDVPAYYWYQTLDGVTAWFPQIQDNFSDTTRWIATGDKTVNVTGNAIEASDFEGNDESERVYGEVGDLETKFVADFDYYQGTAESGAYWSLCSFQSGTDYPYQSGMNSVGLIVDMGNYAIYTRSYDGSSENSTQTGDSISLSVNTQYYVRIIRDGDDFTFSFYTSRDRTSATKVGTRTLTDTGITGLKYFQSGYFTGGNSGAINYKITNLKIYNGVTSV